MAGSQGLLRNAAVGARTLQLCCNLASQLMRLHLQQLLGTSSKYFLLPPPCADSSLRVQRLLMVGLVVVSSLVRSNARNGNTSQGFVMLGTRASLHCPWTCDLCPASCRAQPPAPCRAPLGRFPKVFGALNRRSSATLLDHVLLFVDCAWRRRIGLCNLYLVAFPSHRLILAG